jgi:hypothetical protein
VEKSRKKSGVNTDMKMGRTGGKRKVDGVGGSGIMQRKRGFLGQR